MRSQRLDPLLKVKQRRQDDVAREVAERDRAVVEQQARLDALRRYALEYAVPGGSSLTSPALLANRLAFRERLDTAIAQQSRVVSDTRQQSDVERARLLLASRETHVLEKLSASYRAEESRTVEQRSQREMDDLGARRVSSSRRGEPEPEPAA
ncbi:flagellar export protein FliJ [Lysobacter sp. A286]